MPLVRVNVGDDPFDTFDFAEMTDHRNQHAQRNWSSRLTGGDGATPVNSRHAQSPLTPTLEMDDVTLDSSGGRKSEESDRVGPIPSRGITHKMRGYSNSSLSVASTNTNSVSLGNCDNVYPNPSPHNGQFPLYETDDNLDKLQHDPRNPFNHNSNNLRANWGENIPEEDETSLSTVEDSSAAPSVPPSLYQNQHSMPNSQHRPQRHRPKQLQPSVPDLDDCSVASHQSSRQDFNRRPVIHDNSAQIISQLESQVMKINFELATTKSSLDEMQLENRRLTDNKDKLSTNIFTLQEENDRLYLKIERLEKEKILRNMSGTKGSVARSSTDQAKAEDGGSSNAMPFNRAYVPVSKQKMGKVGGGLEVPFRTSESDYHLRPKRFSQSEFSFNELSTDGDGTSRGSRGDMEDSAHSIPLCDGSDHNYDGIQLSDGDEQEHTDQRGKLNLFAMIGGGNRPALNPSLIETAKKFEEASLALLAGGNSKAEKEAEIPTQILPSNQQEDFLEGDEEDEEDENDIGSNPQGEDSNDDDPFSTWSAPGDPKRKQPEKNWLQRGLGGRGRDSISSKSHSISSKSRQPPPNEMIEDPFDCCNDSQSNDKFGSLDGSEKYTSFADNTSNGSSSHGNNRDPEMQGRKRFGLFKGMIGGGRR